MAKKKQEVRQEPIISSIPVPPSDSALVIDLPDGQKLLVGKIEAGTVIEVATWRGTGRPDSRTNRLMLGMSNDSQPNEPEENREVAPITFRSLKFPQNVFFILNRALKKFKTIASSLVISLKKTDISNLRFNRINLKRLKQLQVPNFIGPKKQRDSQTLKSLKLEDDFDADFQRILDEVSQRRAINSDKSVQKGAAQGKKSKGTGKKPIKTQNKSAKKSK